jgi:hypothetical protein
MACVFQSSCGSLLSSSKKSDTRGNSLFKKSLRLFFIKKSVNVLSLGDIMSDQNQMNSTDEELLDTGADVAALPEGEELPELESGDDLANQALAEANNSQIPLPSKAGNQALGDALTALQNVIERNVNELDRIKEELQVERESLKNVFENDVELAEAEEQASVITQKLKERKTRIQTSPQAMQLKSKIGELTEQKKEIEEALNNHLLNLYQVTGAKMFDTSDGTQREFDIRASIKGMKKQKKEN